jgi:hypothetical protein
MPQITALAASARDERRRHDASAVQPQHHQADHGLRHAEAAEGQPVRAVGRAHVSEVVVPYRPAEPRVDMVRSRQREADEHVSDSDRHDEPASPSDHLNLSLLVTELRGDIAHMGFLASLPLRSNRAITQVE